MQVQPCNNSHRQYAMRDGPSCGPIYGAAQNLQINDNGAASYTAFPCSYNDTLGRSAETIRFTGAKGFTAEDYEVWVVTCRLQLQSTPPSPPPSASCFSFAGG